MRTIVAYPAFKNRGTNPYQAQLYDELKKSGWRILDLDVAIRRWILPDIVHLHWPDGFAFHRSVCKSAVRSAFLILLISFYRLTGAKLVWTVHNLRSHEHYHPRIEKCFWQLLYKRLNGWIFLSNYSKQLMLEKTGLVELPHAVIPLGVYRRLTSKPDCGMTRTGERRSLLFFGNIRSYKAVISLVEAFSETHDRELQLTIAGRCEDAELAACLKRNAESDSRIRLLLKFIPDEELEQLIESADGIVIPYTGSLNSGVAFLALTYGKPVLCPKTPTFTELAGDFDTGQFHLFEPPLRAQQLSDFNRKLKNGPGPSPCIPEKYSWPVIADQHNAYFKTLLSE